MAGNFARLIVTCLVCTSFASDEVTIVNSYSVTKAAQTLEKSSMATPELMQVTNLVMGKGSNNLRKQPKGYSGLDGARKLLNDMIYESMSKYDAEIAKCTDYYSRQCAALEA